MPNIVSSTFHGLTSQKKKRSTSEINDLRTKQDKDLIAQCQPALEELETLRFKKLDTYNFRKKIGIPPRNDCNTNLRIH